MRYLVFMVAVAIISIIAWARLEEPGSTAEFVLENCHQATTDMQLEECTGMEF